jgi:ABC-type spermidine/putrescine transport system permease subunit I
MKKLIRDNFTEFGLTIGLAVSLLVTMVASVWEWVENPGGIFRDDEGTNWQFVFETAWSWLIPTFVYTVVAVSLAHLLWISTAWVISKLTTKED